jgi:hypothetical protein
MQYNWCSRDEWAERTRSVYSDMTEGMDFGPSAVSSYASPEEIEQAIFELQCQWSRCGFEMRIAKKKAGPLAQQPGETGIAYYQRYCTMSEAEQDLSYAPERLRAERKAINKVIRGLRDDELVSEASQGIYRGIMECSEALIVIRDRWDVLFKQDYDKFVEMIANRPIDDAAWEEELQRRRDLENPQVERVNVVFRRIISTDE